MALKPSVISSSQVPGFLAYWRVSRRLDSVQEVQSYTIGFGDTLISGLSRAQVESLALALTEVLNRQPSDA